MSKKPPLPPKTQSSILSNQSPSRPPLSINTTTARIDNGNKSYPNGDITSNKAQDDRSEKTENFALPEDSEKIEGQSINTQLSMNDNNNTKKNIKATPSFFFRFFEEKLETISPNRNKLGNHRKIQNDFIEQQSSKKIIGVAWDKKKRESAYLNVRWVFPKTPHLVTNNDLTELKDILTKKVDEGESETSWSNQKGYNAKIISKPLNNNQNNNQNQIEKMNQNQNENSIKQPSLNTNIERKFTAPDSLSSYRKLIHNNNLQNENNERNLFKQQTSTQVQYTSFGYNQKPNRSVTTQENKMNAYGKGAQKITQSTDFSPSGYTSVNHNNSQNLFENQTDKDSRSITSYNTIADPQKQRETNRKLMGRYGIPPLSHEENQSSSGYREWNTEFQKTLKEVNEAAFGIPEKNFELASIAKQFVDTATTYGKIIISELSIKDPNLKSVKPIPLGGVAGGLKFIHGNILFKLGQDILLEENPEFWMYGGKNGPNHEAAMKSLANEILGLSAHMTTFIPGLRYPLMAAVDFKGFRLLALSIIPINSNTLVYGSNDGGVTCHNSNSEVSEKMKKVADKINIKTHKSGFQDPKDISGPGDIECHIGLDGETYVLDFGRLLPPEDPTFETDLDERGIFFKLLRTEFIKRLDYQLNPDALCDFHTGSIEEKKADTLDITRATRHLYHNIIPNFAKTLSEESETTFENILNNQITSKKELIDSLGAISVASIHRTALNIRHLGYIRNHSTSKAVRYCILLVCLARTMKNMFKDVQRKTMNLVSVPSDEPFARALVTFIHNFKVDERKSDGHWQFLFQAAQEKFSSLLSVEESQNLPVLRKSINLKYLVAYFLKISLIKLKGRATRDLWKSFETFELSLDDVKSLEAKVKHAPVIPFATAMFTLTKAEQKKEDPPEYLRLLKVAETKFEDAHSVATVCPFSFFHWGNTATMIANFTSDEKEKEEKFNQSHKRFELALEYQPKFDLLLHGYSQSLTSHANSNPPRAQELNQKLENIKNFSALKAQKQTETLDYESVKD